MRPTPNPLLLLLALLAATALASPALARGAAMDARLLHLRDGRTLWVEIQDHDVDGFVVERLDNGGRVRLPWSLLDPSMEQALRQQFGYVDALDDEVFVEADRLVLADGTEVVGQIVGRSESELVVKSGGRVLYVPMTRLREAATKVQVPALDVYSRDELYELELTRLQPSDAAGHLELAEYCERILDFRRAVEHYRLARELDPGVQGGEFDAALARATRKAESQEQLDALHEVDTLRARKRYDEALLAAQAFADTYPESPFEVDVAKRVERIERDREEALRELVIQRWYFAGARLAQKAGRELQFEQALAYLDGRMSEEILERVTEDLQANFSATITQDDVLQYWAERFQRLDGRPRTLRMKKASYGHGTWLLGEDRALEGLEVQKTAEVEGPKSERDAERERIEEKVRRYLKNQEIARKTKSSENEAEEVDAFWKTWSSNSKAQWIVAYYAENSGDMRVERVTFSNCSECGGTGVREQVHVSAMGRRQGSGNADLKACVTCQNIGKVRRVHFR